MTGPLDGVRVVDLTAMLAGPYATMFLTDLGADVVKVEPPSGDLSRRAGPFRDDDDRDGLAGYFQSVNRGKRSVVLNLKSAVGQRQFQELARHADIVVENYSAGVMERLGLSYEVLKADNPRLIYAALRGFGDPRTGVSPYGTWPAFDVVAQAMGGFLGITGTSDGAPVKSGPGIGDLFPGVLLALGILAALHHRSRTGVGQFVDVAMYDAVLSLCERIVYQHSYTGAIPAPQGNSHPLFCPFDILPTADGYIALAANDAQWAIVCHAMGRPDMATDARFATNQQRKIHSAELLGTLSAWLSQMTTTEVVTRLGGKVPIGPVNSVADIYADPHVAARQMLVQVEQPGSQRPVTIAGQPIKFSDTCACVATRAPILGEHDITDILSAWG
ncbi:MULTISPECIES: CoA transferase [Mycobacterium]|uniref:CoA transferase n=1 Tax=Mycobacterium TaxID=1763 RepID=UPI000F28B604|nr:MULTISPECIES: CoA transferase [Mycobacterium]VAZ69693.1 Acetyl-CoA:oxalate CoA-transferase [Mycobacterium kansasii]